MLVDKHCSNCNSYLEKNQRYCPWCGQEYSEKNISFRLIFKDFLEEILSMDAGLFKSIKPLLIKPGFLTEEYVSGKRASYISPLKLYLSISLVYFLLLSFNDSTIKPKLVNQDVHSITEYNDGLSTIEQKFSKIDRELFWTKFNSYLSPMIFFLLPVFAFILKLLFPKTKKVYLEHLVFSFHFHSFMFAVFILALIISRFIVNSYVLTGIFMIVFLYLILAMIRLYKEKVSWIILKFLLLISSYTLVFIVFLIATFMVAVVLF